MKSAVLVIDVQKILFNPFPKPNDSDTVLLNINSITSLARKKQLPVIFIQHEKENSEIEFNSDGWQLVEELQVESTDIVVRKTTPDSFLNTNLESVLNSQNIDHLIICGYASEFCVDTTVRRAAGLGYGVDIIADAHTTHDKEHATGAQIREHHNITLPNVTSFGITISAIMTKQFIDEVK